MKCFNTKKVYCQCEFVKDGKCPILEIKKLIERCKSSSFNTSEFMNAIVTLNIVEMLDKIRVDDNGVQGSE